MNEFTFIKTAGAGKRGLILAEAAEYAGLSVPNFLKAVESGRLPHGVMLFGATVWDRRLLDECLDRIFAATRARYQKARA